MHTDEMSRRGAEGGPVLSGPRCKGRRAIAFAMLLGRYIRMVPFYTYARNGGRVAWPGSLRQRQPPFDQLGERGARSHRL